MTIYSTQETEVEVDLSARDIYNELADYEKEELLDLLLQEYTNKSYSISNKLRSIDDSNFLQNKEIWDYIIKLVKYEDSTLLNYIIEELEY